jgi:nitrogen fixation/metabolism regulation signal transduction histidine kinase
MKLDGKLGPVEQTLVAKSVKTIVEQVNAMQRLVNEFRDYARLPAAELKPLDLNVLVRDVLSLYGDEPGGTAGSPIAIRSELDSDCPLIRGDAQQLRQVIHNLLQNAQDAIEQMPHARAVLIRTQWLPAGRRVRLSVLDSGAGFPEHILKRAFEPYVTTKAKGTGLGLAVVKKIADDHGARVDVSNRVLDGAIAGAQVSLSFEVSSSPSA